MRAHRVVWLLLALAVTGCSTARVVRLEGPHPQEYHKAVYERLRDATRTCRTVVACRQSLTGALKELAEEVTTKGTKLHRLVTQRK